VSAHGSDRRPLFVFDTDRTDFLERLWKAADRHELSCIAYCLMGNHYHLIVQIPDARISKALQELHGGYSRNFNLVHGRTAHLFRHRFLAELVEDEAYFLTLCRYLAHNPVRVGLCRRPSDWPWSSHRASAGLAPVPAQLRERMLRDAFAGAGDWRARYRDFVDPPGTSDVGENTLHF
jgi:REP element-mobilizing transposase RayT